jgi:hypothetical protein
VAERTRAVLVESLDEDLDGGGVGQPVASRIASTMAPARAGPSTS